MSVASKSALATPFELALIGNLRPWEVENFARKIVDQETALSFMIGLHDHLIRNIDSQSITKDIEYVVRIATETYDILGDHRNVIKKISDNSLTWRIFVKAFQGTDIIELEHFALSYTEEVNTNKRSMDAATEVIKSYIINNRIESAELPELIEQVHSAIAKDKTRHRIVKDKNIHRLNKHYNSLVRQNRAVIEKSITPEALISFEDGKPYKTLRRHLTMRGLTPEAYRAKYGLPFDYPMTSASYSAQRSELARSLGLGRQREDASKVGGPVETVSEAPAKTKKAGRPHKVS